ncbi:hypothetical protein OCGS_1628 [Oceaniovalibus guishaninsula JLT2003]|uniref:Uncharacterized protein n=1 Tax=Oceaniovalibus guishaninsula JLT2003 TaxID=1231392 RepID=K2HBX4_9RHOB|nr:hypothetical protein [Oceaniovalibus guishaninsula]EKE44112.1 hypothetical protein OCGS_1628 [Oceaniovalibus guishaninsula JLT2003]
MAEIIWLRPVEGGMPDMPGPESGGEGTIDDLAVQIAGVTMAWQGHRVADVAAGARTLAVTATGLGLDRLARVACTICVLCGRDDPAALAANVARLSRLGDAALIAFWGGESAGG